MTDGNEAGGGGFDDRLGQALRWSRWHSVGAGVLVVVAIAAFVVRRSGGNTVVDVVVVVAAVAGMSAAWLAMIRMSNATGGGSEVGVTAADRARVARTVVRGHDLEGWDRGLARQVAPGQLWMQSVQAWSGALPLASVGMLGPPDAGDSVMTVVLFPFLVVGGLGLTALAQWSGLRWRRAATMFLFGPPPGH